MVSKPEKPKMSDRIPYVRCVYDASHGRVIGMAFANHQAQRAYTAAFGDGNYRALDIPVMSFEDVMGMIERDRSFHEIDPAE
jgi:hypothetical protein